MKSRKLIVFSMMGIFIFFVGILFYLQANKEESTTEESMTEESTSMKSSAQLSESTATQSEIYESTSSEPKVSVTELNEALLNAISEENTIKIEELLSKGAFVDTVNEKGESGLLVATHKDNLKMAQLFLEHDANVNLQDAIQDSPFLYAGAEGRTDILRIMIDHNPDTKLTNRFGGNALIPAAEKGHLANVQLLLEETDVDVNHINTPGWTALLEAIVYTNGDENQQKIIRVLLDNGADPNLVDSQGVTPLQHARERNFQKIATILKEAGANG